MRKTRGGINLRDFVVPLSINLGVALLAFLFSQLGVLSKSALYNPPFLTLSLALVNILLWSAIPGMVYLLTGGILSSSLVTLFVSVLLAVFNLKKMSHLNDVIVPFDFVFLREASFFVRYIDRFYIWGMPPLLVVLAVVIFRLRKRYPLRVSKLPFYFRSILVSPILLFSMLFGMGCLTWGGFTASLVDGMVKPATLSWNQSSNAYSHGWLVTFLFNLRQLNRESLLASTHIADAPDSEVVREPTGSAIAKGTLGRTPPRHVVVLMLEALYDISKLGIEFSEDPLPNLHRFFAENRETSGLMRTPTFGGQTANVEFEVLTGMSLFLLPSGPIPYKQYIRHELDAIPWEFQRAGFSTNAVHNYEKRFFNRDRVYPLLGFQQFVGLEDMPGADIVTGNKVLRVPDDLSLFSSLANILDTASGPTFSFAVSMFLHSDYDWELPERIRRVSPRNSGLSPDAVNALENYASRLRLVDERFGDFFEKHVKNRSDTLLVVFGDHQPNIAPSVKDLFETRLTEVLGDTLPLYRVPKHGVHYVTPYTVFGATVSNKSVPRLLGAHCLGNYVLSLSGIPRGREFQQVDAFCSKVPAFAPELFQQPSAMEISRLRTSAYQELFSENGRLAQGRENGGQ
jgi:phosphoglycerol transferase MdoB-like AlkP superfamily enzyme